MTNYLMYHNNVLIAECIHMSTVMGVLSVVLDDPYRDKDDYYKVTKNNKIIFSIIAYPTEV